MSKVRCQRIGCDSFFSVDDNPPDSCRYHDSGPIFHDAMKEWSCCKKRSHDFTLFLQIPGCKTGKHTTEKPLLTKNPPATPSARPSIPATTLTSVTTRESCSRCRQGFFCSDHFSQPKDSINAVSSAPAESNTKVEVSSPPVKKKVDINQPQVCKNKGCSQTFKEKDNHETACSFHPGPAIFHDSKKGWKCCDIHVQEFDEFVSIPPCTKGWHNADSTP